LALVEGPDELLEVVLAVVGDKGGVVAWSCAATMVELLEVACKDASDVGSNHY
jgi:hypothetical protein